GRFHTLAPWVKRGNGATPSDRWYAAYHQKELTADIIPHAYAALRIPEAHIREPVSSEWRRERCHAARPGRQAGLRRGLARDARRHALATERAVSRRGGS